MSKKSEQDFQLFGATPRAIRILRLRQLSHLNERQLHEQTLVAALTVGEVALIHYLQCLIKKLCRAFLSLFLILCLLSFAHLQQLNGLLILRHEHVTYVRCKSVDEVSAVKPLLYNRVEQ